MIKVNLDLIRLCTHLSCTRNTAKTKVSWIFFSSVELGIVFNWI